MGSTTWVRCDLGVQRKGAAAKAREGYPVFLDGLFHRTPREFARGREILHTEVKFLCGDGFR